MTDAAPQLPDDVDALKALLIEARAQLAERDIAMDQINAQIDKLKRMQFGRKSEQLDRQIERLETDLEDLTGGRGVADVRKPARGARGRPSVQRPRRKHCRRVCRAKSLRLIPVQAARTATAPCSHLARTCLSNSPSSLLRSR
uniref:transposase n=1 Tax=Paraburkholderia dilworthii TaxID=948106 RepID=UPI002ADE6717|nr:transposase [Paraburkholderia dilworthii]